MDKPISLKVQEFQQNISNVIGESELPIFMVKYILKDLQAEIDRLTNDFAQKEIEEYYQSQESKEAEPTEEN